MPEFVLHRNYSMRSLMGHIIDFKKGQPTYVPPICAREAAALGAECVDGKVDLLGPESIAPTPLSFDERHDSILAAFQLIEGRAQRGDFSGAGIPKASAMEKLLGFEMEPKELAPMWTTYLVDKDVAE